MRKLLVVLFSLVTLPTLAQQVTVKETIRSTRNGRVLTNGMRLAIADSVRIENGGLLVLTTDEGIRLLLTTGTHLVKTFYDRKMKHLTHADTLQMLLSRIGVPRCDSIERALRKQVRSMHDAMSKKESLPIQLKASVSSKSIVTLTWKGWKANRYYVIASDLMEELLLVQERPEEKFVFNGTPYQSLLIRVYADGCMFSNFVVLTNKNDELTVVR